MFTNRKNKGKITFGNIMLTLLVLGLFVVIGLIGTLYVTLTKTPEQTAANYKREQESQAQIECWSPTNKSGRDCGASTPAQANNLTPQQKSAASAVAYQIEAQNQAASEAGLADGDALTRGDAPKKPKKLTPKTAELPSGSAYFSGMDIEDWWINYPWDAVDIEAHNRRAQAGVHSEEA